MQAATRVLSLALRVIAKDATLLRNLRQISLPVFPEDLSRNAGLRTDQFLTILCRLS